MAIPSCEQREASSNLVKGVYGNPAPLWSKGLKLNEFGVNSLFVHSGSMNKDLMEKARSEGLKVYAEFATLNGKNYVETHTEAWAINDKGEKVQAATWFMGVCPTEPGFRKYRTDQLRNLLLEFDLDGVWLDYVHWHAQFEDPEPILPETCFCDHCLSSFSESTGIESPEGSTAEKAIWILEQHDEAWRDWRCQVIYDMIVDMKQIVQEVRPGALLGLYHSPWDDEEFNAARRRILGLDFDLLKKSVDVFSPMVYHARMGREPLWVRHYVEWLSDRLAIDPASDQKIWPIVQAHNDPYEISGEEFGEVLRYGLAGESSGVMMFTTASVAEDEEKLKEMKRIYLSQQD